MSADCQSHGPYIAAVADAFAKVRLDVLVWDADDYDPRCGAIRLNPEQMNSGSDEIWAGWREDKGWYVLVEDKHDNGREPSRFVYDLDCYPICNPAGVVRAVCSFFGLPPGDWLFAEDEYPEVDLRHVDWEDDDPQFEAALAVYAAGGER